MDSALIYEDPADRLLAAIIGRAIKDYCVARMRNLLSADGVINDKILAKHNVGFVLSADVMQGCSRLEIRTAYIFMHSGLNVMLEALAPNQDPSMIRDSAEKVITGEKVIVWQ